MEPYKLPHRGQGLGNSFLLAGTDEYSNCSVKAVIVIIDMKFTTIAISKATRDALSAIGSKDQSFEEILQELLSKWNEKC